MGILSGGKDLLFTLVLKVGWAAALAALLVRFRSFRKLVFTENRDSDQKVMLLLFLTPPLAIGVMLRLVGYRFFDLTLEGSFLMGLIGGQDRRPARWLADQPACVRDSRVAVEPDGRARRLACRSDPRRHSRERRRLAFRPFPVSQHSAMVVEVGALRQGELGDASAVRCRRIRGGADRAGQRGSLAMALFRSSHELGRTAARGAFFDNVR